MVQNLKFFHIWTSEHHFSKKKIFSSKFFSSNFELKFKFLGLFIELIEASASEISCL